MLMDFRDLTLRTVAVSWMIVGLTACVGGGPNSTSSSSFAVAVSSVTVQSYDQTDATLLVTGTAQGLSVSPLTTLTIYTDSACSLDSIGSATAQVFTTTGVQVQVSSTSTSQLYVKANTESQCFFLTSFNPDFGNPAPPVFGSTSPASPSITVNTPLVFGQAPAYDTSVSLFTDSQCTNLVGAGSPTLFSTLGIQVTLSPNSVSSIYGQTVEPFGHKSTCALLTTYTQNSNLPAAPTLVSMTPLSPSNTSTTPVLIGQVPNGVVTVNFFSDSGCTQTLASGSATNFTSVGISIPVASNASTGIWGQGIDGSNNSSPCGYLTTFVNDTIPPIAPSFTSTNPVSPERSTIYPLIIGQASNDTINIQLFSDSLCKTNIGIGTAINFQSSGVAATVGTNMTTNIYAKSFDLAGNASACTFLTAFTNDDNPPDPPIFLATDPISPNNRSNQPLVTGLLTAPQVITVNFFEDFACATLITSGTAADFTGGGIAVTVPDNTATSIYAEGVDSLGNTSSCTLMTTYAYSTAAVSPATFIGTSPSSPSRQTGQPYILGSVTNPTSINNISLYSDSLCSNYLNSSNPTNFSNSGIQIPITLNTNNTVYDVVTDIYGNVSPCTLLTTYVQDNIPPVPPTFGSIQPTSPNNSSVNPLLTGSCSNDTVRVKFFDSAGCQTYLGSSLGVTPAAFASGVNISVPANHTTTIYAAAFDAAGNESTCQLLTTYTNDSLNPGRPNFKSISPTSPSYVAPFTLIGTISGSTDIEPPATVSLYSNSSCSQLIVSGTATQFTTTGLQGTLANGTITSIYGQTADIVGNLSLCNSLTQYFYGNAGPTNLTLNLTQNGSVSIDWQNDNNATTYMVKRSLISGGPYEVIAPAIATNSFIDSSVNQNATYYYVVDSQNASGFSLDSTEQSITVSEVQPAAPTNFRATPDNAQVLLAWDRNSSQINYTIYRGQQSGGPYTMIASEISALNYTDTQVSNGVPYYYVMTASNPWGTSPYSAEVSVVPRTTPAAPSNLSGRYDPLTGHYVLTWTAPSYYGGFNILRAKAPGPTAVYASVGGNVFTYTDTKPDMDDYVPNQPNYYAVQAIWGSSVSGSSNQVGFANEAGPTNLNAFAGDGQVSLFWNPMGNGYQILRSLTPGGPYTLVGTSTGVQYIDSTVVDGQTYYYVVSANMDNTGMAPLYTQYSTEVAATPRTLSSIAAPTNLLVTYSTAGAVLAWAAPVQYSGFNIYVAQDSPTNFFLINNQVATNNYVDTTTNSAHIYYYKVSATWGGTESALTPAVLYAPVQNLSALSSANQIALTWTAVTNATSYQILRGTNSGGPYSFLGTATTASYTDSSAQPNTGYYYVVTATVTGGLTGQASNEVSGMAGTGTVPNGLSITGISSAGVTLNWPLVQNAVNYDIWWSNTSGTGYTKYARVSAPPFVVSATNPMDYYFVVTSVINNTDSAYSNEVSAFPQVLQAPVVTANNGSVLIDWSASNVTGNTSFNLERTSDLVNFTTLQTGLSNSTTQFLDTTVSNGTVYYYAFQPIFANVTADPYSPLSSGVVPTATAPLVPQGLIVTGNTTGTQINLIWSSVPNATDYQVGISATSGGPYSYSSSEGENSATINTSANTPIYLVVESVDGTVVSAPSSELAVVPQATPASPSATVVNNSQILVSWSAVSCGTLGSAVQYDLLRSTDQNSYSTLVTGLTTPNYTDTTNLVVGQSYTYEYLPYCSGPIAGAISTAGPIVGGNLSGVSLTPPQVPLGLIALPANSSSVALSWIAVPNAVSYNVYRSTTSGSGYALIQSQVSSTSTSDTSLAPNAYYYTVTSISPSGVESSMSAQASVSLSLAAPAGVSATAYPGSILVSWGLVPSTSSYSVYRGDVSGGPYGIIASNLTSLSYSDTTPIAGQTYYYVVTAVDNNGNPSQYSNEASANAGAFMNLQVPIELTDSGIASNVTTTAFARTQTSLNTTAYDGTVSYYLDIVAANNDSISGTISLIDQNNTAVATANVPAGTVNPTRMRVSFSPDVGSNIYRLQLSATSAQGLLQLYSARVMVNQTNATKTRIYIPLTSMDGTPNSADSAAPLGSTSATTLTSFSAATLYQRITSSLATIDTYNAWELETVAAASNGASGVVVLNDDTQNAYVDGSETVINNSVPTVGEGQFSEGITNFAAINEYDMYEVQAACWTQCSTGAVALYKAGLWLNLVSLSKARIYFRIGMAAVDATTQMSLSERTFLDLSAFLNPVVSYAAVADPGAGASTTVQLLSVGTQDGTTNSPTDVSGSDIVFSSQGKTIQWSSGLTVTSGNRFLPNVIPSNGGTTNFYGSSIVVDISK